jgi:hypothetical protein
VIANVETVALVSLCSLSLLACGSSSSPPVATTLGRDAASSDSDSSLPSEGIVKVVLLGRNDLCGIALPTGGAVGGTSCRMLLDGIASGCSAPGLSASAEVDVQTIKATGASLPAGSVCTLTQVAPSAGQTGCADPSANGWCYVRGSCSADAGTQCQYDLCATDGFFTATGYVGESEHPVYADAWLVCT